MGSKIKFTIGIPVRNGETYLHSAILSAFLQSHPAYEILVVDDASTDRSAEIAKSAEWKGKVSYVYNDKCTGWVDAFNRIAHLAKGDFVTILGCDDLLHTDFLYYVERALNGNRTVQFCYSGLNYISQDGTFTGVSPVPHSTKAILYGGKDYSQRYLQGVFLGEHIHRFVGVAIERNLLVKDCPIRREAGLIADDDLFVRIGNLTDVVGMTEPLASLRNHSMSITGRLESLSLRLAEDYLFQVHSSEEHSHLGPKYIEMYQALALRFINALLYEGLRTGKEKWIKRAIELRADLENEMNDEFNRKVSLFTRLIWMIVGDGKGIHIDIYLKSVPSMRTIKKKIFRK